MMPSLPSLRLWLLSTSVLTVLAGFSLLLGMHRFLALNQRQLAHKDLVRSLVVDQRTFGSNSRVLENLGVELQLLPYGTEQTPRLVQGQGDRSWLQSVTLIRAPNEDERLLLVRQDVSASLAYERKLQLLLIAGAGVSTLLTAALLRVVLWRGLSLPLRQLSHQVNALKADELGAHMIDVNGQPLELQPIALAFNRLEARLADAWKRERHFVDGVAHELRTPITVISSHSQRLQAEMSQNPSAAVALIAAEAKRLGDLISVMLDFARLDAGRLALDMGDLDPEALLLDAFERLQSLAPDRLQLAPSSDRHLPRIRVDAARVHQCLAALVENALRYSTRSVVMEASTSPMHVTLHVRDQGPGIPVEEHQHVVERFVRGRSARGTQGSGLGLAIVDDLTRAMHGELLIRQVPEGGADLQMRFKLSAGPPAP